MTRRRLRSRCFVGGRVLEFEVHGHDAYGNACPLQPADISLVSSPQSALADVALRQGPDGATVIATAKVLCEGAHTPRGPRGCHGACAFEENLHTHSCKCTVKAGFPVAQCRLMQPNCVQVAWRCMWVACPSVQTASRWRSQHPSSASWLGCRQSCRPRSLAGPPSRCSRRATQPATVCQMCADSASLAVHGWTVTRMSSHLPTMFSKQPFCRRHDCVVWRSS